jgi:hypothetical protein
LPDDALVSSKVMGIVLDVNERTIRRHPPVPRVFPRSDIDFGLEISVVEDLDYKYRATRATQFFRGPAWRELSCSMSCT